MTSISATFSEGKHRTRKLTLIAMIEKGDKLLSSIICFSRGFSQEKHRLIASVDIFLEFDRPLKNSSYNATSPVTCGGGVPVKSGRFK